MRFSREGFLGLHPQGNVVVLAYEYNQGYNFSISLFFLLLQNVCREEEKMIGSHAKRSVGDLQGAKNSPLSSRGREYA